MYKKIVKRLFSEITVISSLKSDIETIRMNPKEYNKFITKYYNRIPLAPYFELFDDKLKDCLYVDGKSKYYYSLLVKYYHDNGNNDNVLDDTSRHLSDTSRNMVDDINRNMVDDINRNMVDDINRNMVDDINAIVNDNIELTEFGYYYLMLIINKNPHNYSKSKIWEIYGKCKSNRIINQMMLFLIEKQSFKSFIKIYRKSSKDSLLKYTFIKGLSKFGGDERLFNKTFNELRKDGFGYEINVLLIEYFMELEKINPILKALKRMDLSFDISAINIINTIYEKDINNAIDTINMDNDTINMDNDTINMYNDTINMNDNTISEYSKGKTIKIPDEKTTEFIQLLYKICRKFNLDIQSFPFLFQPKHINHLIDHLDDTENTQTINQIINNLTELDLSNQSMEIIAFHCGIRNNQKGLIKLMQKHNQELLLKCYLKGYCLDNVDENQIETICKSIHSLLLEN
jgi:hypothetical protein